MKDYPRLAADGQKLTLEDLNDGWELAGKIDDQVRATLAQVAVASGDRTGWVIPVQDGPIVVPNGASGTVSVKAFTMLRSPGSGETTRDLVSAFYAGGTETVPTPVPTLGNHRWDLLYAKISIVDAVSESAMVEDPSTDDIAAQTVNTRKRSQVTLAWVQGVAAATATDPYPAVNFPALPAPAAGEAHVPLAFAHVHFDAAPATVTYNVDRIFNETPVAKINPQTGAQAVGVAGFGRISGTPGNMVALTDTKTLATTAGTGINIVGAKRPAAHFEPAAGGHRLWIPLSFDGASVISSSWTVLGGTSAPIISPDTALAINKHNPLDLLNRWFRGVIQVSHAATAAWAHDQNSAAADCVFPTKMPHGVLPPPEGTGWGNTIRANGDFETESGLVAGDWYCACMFRDPTGSGEATDLALLARRVTSGGYTKGAMHVAAREFTAGRLDGKFAVIILDASPQFFPFNF